MKTEIASRDSDLFKLLNNNRRLIEGRSFTARDNPGGVTDQRFRHFKNCIFEGFDISDLCYGMSTFTNCVFKDLKGESLWNGDILYEVDFTDCSFDGISYLPGKHIPTLTKVTFKGCSFKNIDIPKINIID